MASRNVTEVIAAQAPVAGESVYDMAVQQLLTSANRLGLDEGIRQILSQSKRELTVHFPVQMDNGEIQVFTGHKVQHDFPFFCLALARPG